MGYRPLSDVMILARPRVKYFGAYPSGFLVRARDLLGVSIDDPILHVCSGKIEDYPFEGYGPNDGTVDIDKSLQPEWVMDVRKDLPNLPKEDGGPLWPAILADPPYGAEEADNYNCGRDVLPDPNKLLKLCLEHVRPGGRVGVLHYIVPRPPKEVGETKIRFVAVCGVMTGFGQRIRAYSVFERRKK